MSPLFGTQILEMSRLEMGLIRIYVGVQLEGEDIRQSARTAVIVSRKREPVLSV
jgi:hypothetical protein